MSAMSSSLLSGLIGFAGIWDRWDKGEQPIESFAIATVPPNQSIAPMHDRMPVILGPAQYAAWLDPATPTDQLHAMLQPAAEDLLDYYPVSTYVNKPANQGPQCIEPVPVLL